MIENPFTLTFGEKPELIIERIETRDSIIKQLTSKHPSSRVFMLTGIRGSGKTVLLTSISKKISEDKNRKTIDLNSSSSSILNDFSSYLYNDAEFKKMFIEAKIGFSVFGVNLSFEIQKEKPSYQVLIEEMLEKYVERNKKILITIDEVSNNNQIREITSLVQILIRKGFPIFLIMTGLYKNIDDLQNSKDLTFLYRAEKIFLKNLDIAQVNKKYQSVFNDEKLSKDMATLTKGYPYAFQTLGYLMFDSKDKSIDKVLDDFDFRLGEYVYRKIYSELSTLEKEIVKIVSNNVDISTSELASKLNKEPNLVSNYKNILIKKGILNDEYGKFVFALPRFNEYLKLI